MRMKRVCCNSCNFFFPLQMRVTKKPSGRVIFFFCCKSCKPAYTTYSKKNFTRRDGFFVTRIYSGKKNYTTYRKNKKITRLDDFFVHAFTAKIKKLHDLTAKKQLPILLKMHACRRCAHLWPRSGR